MRTCPNFATEVIFDYTHFLYRHKGSFKDFKVIRDSDNIQICYYKSRALNFLPISPVSTFISIKKIFPEKNMFQQVYMSLKSNNLIFLKATVSHDNNNNVKIHNDVIIQVSDWLYMFRKLILWIVNRKFEVMWCEDKIMLEQFFEQSDYSGIDCVPKPYNLSDKLGQEFNEMFDSNEKVDLEVRL